MIEVYLTKLLTKYLSSVSYGSGEDFQSFSFGCHVRVPGRLGQNPDSGFIGDVVEVE